MNRQSLSNGQWFDLDAIIHSWEEGTRWNGNNHISLVTGSQWEHQKLYRTASGRWVLHSWSQYQGSTESWEEIDAAAAARWLVINGHEPHMDCADEYAALNLDATPCAPS